MGYAGQPMKVVKANRALLKKKEILEISEKTISVMQVKLSFSSKNLLNLKKRRLETRLLLKQKEIS